MTRPSGLEVIESMRGSLDLTPLVVLSSQVSMQPLLLNAGADMVKTLKQQIHTMILNDGTLVLVYIQGRFTN